MSITKDNKGFIFRSGPTKQTNNFSSFWDNSTDSDVDEFLGVDVETAQNLYYALLTLVVGQGIADIAKK